MRASYDQVSSDGYVVAPNVAHPSSMDSTAIEIEAAAAAAAVSVTEDHHWQQQQQQSELWCGGTSICCCYYCNSAAGVRGANVKVEQSKKRFEQWEGHNAFYLSGRLMTGANSSRILVSLSMIVASWTAYLFVVVPFLDYKETHYHIKIALILLHINIIFLLLTAFVEPGILPRRSAAHRSSTEFSFQSFKKLKSLKDQYCGICNVIKSTRTKHCKYCNNCCDVFDHHCPWTGNCIGVRNYPFYFCLLLTTTIGCLVILSSSNMVIVHNLILGRSTLTSNSNQQQQPDGEQQQESGQEQELGQEQWYYYWIMAVGCPIMSLWALFLLLSVGALTVFHIYLQCQGLTTCEFMKMRRLRRENEEVVTAAAAAAVATTTAAAAAQQGIQQLQLQQQRDDEGLATAVAAQLGNKGRGRESELEFEESPLHSITSNASNASNASIGISASTHTTSPPPCNNGSVIMATPSPSAATATATTAITSFSSCSISSATGSITDNNNNLNQHRPTARDGGGFLCRLCVAYKQFMDADTKLLPMWQRCSNDDADYQLKQTLKVQRYLLGGDEILGGD